MVFRLLYPRYIPHFTTFGKNDVRRFQHTDLFEQIVDHILAIAMEKGFVDPKVLFIDSTHVKAHANKKNFIREVASVQRKAYQDILDAEVAEDRRFLEKSMKGTSKQDADENDCCQCN